MYALDELQWSPQPIVPAIPVPADLAAESKRQYGMVLPYLAHTSHSRHLSRLMMISDSAMGAAQLTTQQLNVVNLVTAQENACRFCYGMQRAIMKMTGYSEEQVRDIERNLELGDATTRALADFARKLAQSNPRPARAEREALQKLGFSKELVAEVAFTVASACFLQRITTFIAATKSPLEKIERSWYAGLLKPIFWLTRSRFMVKRVPAVIERAVGPLGPLLEALNGTAMPGVYRRMAEHAMSQSVLPPRTKLLMIATVARGLRCTYCESAAASMLPPGELSTADVSDILETLESPKLTGLEAKLLPFARATIRYQPYKMQERTGQLAAELGAEATLEALGLAAFANMTVRLAMLLA